MKLDLNPGFVAPVVREPVDVKSDVAVKVVDSQPATKPDAGKPEAQKPEIPKQDLEQLVGRMNEAMQVFNHALEFRVAESGRVIIKVIDTESGEIIRQIPPEQLVEAFDNVGKAIGLLFDRKV